MGNNTDTTKIALIQKDVEYIKEKVNRLEQIIFGFVGVVFMMVMVAVVSLVIKS